MDHLPSLKCHWCGNIKAGFYHIECALKMSESNFKEASRVAAMYQNSLKIEKSKSKKILALVREQYKDLKYIHNCNLSLLYAAYSELHKLIEEEFGD